MQDHREAIVAGRVAAEVELAGHHMDVICMLVGIRIQHILVPQRQRPLGIIEADDVITVPAKWRGAYSIQI